MHFYNLFSPFFNKLILRLPLLILFLLILSKAEILAQTTATPSATVKTNVAKIPNPEQMTIEADKAEVVDVNPANKTTLRNIKLTGNVIIIHKDAELRADNVLVTDVSESERQLEAQGDVAKKTLANFKHNSEDIKTKVVTVTTGSAQKITYNSKSRYATLTGNATLIQNNNRLEAESIIYNGETGQYVADKAQNAKRVFIVIDNPPEKKQ